MAQIELVVAIWQLVVSPLWLRYFRLGPAEWLWRSMPYLKLQPMCAPAQFAGHSFIRLVR